MARYKWSDADHTQVYDNETHYYIPVAEGQGGWMGDVFRAWLAEGNEPDPYVDPESDS